MKKIKLAVFIILFGIILGNFRVVFAQNTNPVELYFFYDQSCHYCQAALKQLNLWKVQYPNLRLRSFEVTQSEVNGWYFSAMSQVYNLKNISVPAFFIDKSYINGYDENIKVSLENEIKRCSLTSCLNPGSLVNQSTTAAIAVEKDKSESIFPKVMLYFSIILGIAIFWVALRKFFTG